ncbi:MAG: SPOR domain-containing protein [Kangiella sp.]|jgi:cell division protein FtsN|nr:SPOR domain-containing protein [Kangiella sp.]MCW9028307.1 SPOR domain-containing protein [Kangiella sp.]
MTKDYAKKRKTARKSNKRSPRQSRPSRKPISPILVFVGGVLITLFAIFLWVLVKKPEIIEEVIPVKQDTKAVTATETPPEDKTQESASEPRYTYHETLTNKEIKVDTTQSVPTNGNKTYIMQCGAFRKQEDAESIKVEMAFIGFQANVEEKDGWYRVRLGPYNSKRAAESDRHKLQDNNYQDCRIW